MDTDRGPSHARLELRRFWHDFLRPHWSGFLYVALLTIASVLLQLPGPVLTMYIVDRTLAHASLSAINQLCAVFVVLVLVRHVCAYFSEKLTLQLKETIILEVQCRVLAHLHRLPLGFFSIRHSTYLQSRVMSDARSVEGALVRTLVTVGVNGLTFVAGLAFIAWIDVKLAAALSLFLVPFGLIRLQANERMRQLSRDMQEQQARASAAVSESLAGVRTLKSYVRETLYVSRLRHELSALRDVYVRTNWFGIVSNVGTSTVTALSIAFVLWFGARGVLQGSMSLGQVVAVLSLLSFLYAPINSLVAANLSLHQAASAIQRIYEFLLEPAEAAHGRDLAAAGGHIEFCEVTFAYPGGPDVLHDVSFTVEPGRATALVGPSGAGKTTVVNLLLRFYEAPHGRVLVDGVDVRDVSPTALRNLVGVVDQQPFLFSGTILENIRLGHPSASLEEAEDAGRQAFAHEFIQSLPEGYLTRVGERGVRLSGGQCQRIALARLFLKKPKILVLDEAVSAVDSASEAYIQQALAPLISTRTTIIIAHRLSSLMLASKVVLIGDGRVVDQGSHADLMRHSEAYVRLFHEQFQPQIEEQPRAAEAHAAAALKA